MFELNISLSKGLDNIQHGVVSSDMSPQSLLPSHKVEPETQSPLSHVYSLTSHTTSVI